MSRKTGHARIDGMATGILAAAGWLRKLLAFVLVALILVCALFLVFGDLNKSWTVALQVASAVAGAALGSVLQFDQGRSHVENQARPAIRRLVDQAVRIGDLVRRIERHNAEISQDSPAVRLKPERVSDWLDSIGDSLRGEITSTTTAMEDWGDLARDVLDAEIARYKGRDERMSINPASREAQQ